TIALISLRTRLAMQDPQIRKMLAEKASRPKSEETKMKIGMSVRMASLKRQQKKRLQETCLLEWKESIAEAARIGGDGAADTRIWASDIRGIAPFDWRCGAAPTTTAGTRVEAPLGDEEPIGGGRAFGAAGAQYTEAGEDQDTGSVIRDLLRLQPPTYTGSTDGFVVESWLLSLDSCFGLHSYESNVKARFAIHLLRDAADVWWRNEERKLHLTRETVTWEMFEERFRARYIVRAFCAEED
ncbi:hypothetical protein KI387_010901, partial [Taxus chinensis]